VLLRRTEAEGSGRRHDRSPRFRGNIHYSLNIPVTSWKCSPLYFTTCTNHVTIA